MALREIRIDGDPILRKKSREVLEIDDRIRELLDDMEETMRAAEGVGLAAPQIGVLRRIAVVDVGEGLLEMINPVIVASEGEEEGLEGCLSVPNFSGLVKRPQKVRVEFLDREGKKQSIVAENFFAVAVCHELDHLDGILYKDKAEKMYEMKTAEEAEE